MDKLLAYINTLDPVARASFCSTVGTTEGYIRKACSKRQMLGPILCVAIDRATSGSVTRKDLRPDDWHQIWPEMIEAA